MTDADRLLRVQHHLAPDGPTGEQHVVDEHHGGAFDVEVEVAHCAGGHRTKADVVAIQAGVDGADGNGGVDPADLGGEGVGQPDAALLDPHEDHTVEAVCSQVIYESLGSTDKELIELPDSYHVATMDNDAPTIFEKSLEFVRRLEGSDA